MGTRNQTNVEEVTFFLYTWHANLDISALLPTTLVSANIWRCIGECCGSGLPLVQAIRVALSVEKRKAMIKRNLEGSKLLHTEEKEKTFIRQTLN